VLVELGLVEQRYQAVLEVLINAASVSEVAARFGVTRQSVHRWLRYASGGLAGLVDQSTVPGSCPHQMPPAVEARIMELRREHPGWGRARSVIGSSATGSCRCQGGPRSIAAWSATGSSRCRLAAASEPITSGGNGPGPWSCGRWTSSVTGA
jgi:transposase-like protein